MLPYSRGLILDNTNNYGIVKTETVFGFAPKSDNLVNNTFNSTEPLEWIFTHGNFEQRSLPESFKSLGEPSHTEDINDNPKIQTVEKNSWAKPKKNAKKSKKKPRRSPKKTNKCVFKVIKKGKKHKGSGGGGKFKMQGKYILPLILGLLAAKSFLIPIALKALAFLSAKGLMMGFFSTVMASVLSLKGMFDHSHYGYQNRKDDSKTQVEIIQVPSKSEDHVYYDDHYRRGDFIPALFSKMGYDERMHNYAS